MRYYYATIAQDEHSNEICTGVINTFKELIGDIFIALKEYDEGKIGKMWTGKEWTDNPNPPLLQAESKKDPVEEAIDAYTLELVEGGLLL